MRPKSMKKCLRKTYNAYNVDTIFKNQLLLIIAYFVFRWDFVLYKLGQFEEQFNDAIRGAHLDLVFFHDAMVHLFIISRIINTPRFDSQRILNPVIMRSLSIISQVPTSIFVNAFQG